MDVTCIHRTADQIAQLQKQLKALTQQLKDIATSSLDAKSKQQQEQLLQAQIAAIQAQIAAIQNQKNQQGQRGPKQNKERHACQRLGIGLSSGRVYLTHGWHAGATCSTWPNHTMP